MIRVIPAKTRQQTITRLFAVLAGLALVEGCGNGDSPSAPPPDPPRPTTVAVSPMMAELPALGATVRLTAEVRDQNGQVIAGAAVTWRSSNAAVAAVDGTGLVTGMAEGMATITAMAGSAEGTAQITVENPDRNALVALYESTDGPNWRNSDNWLTDAPLGDWFGVETDSSGRVVGLTMAYQDDRTDQWISNNLSGPIPPELGDLANLEYLQFFSNSLTGPIPPELGRLTRLIAIDFNGNNLSGSIPAELGNLASLRSLHLWGNSLTGPIPQSFLQLDDLALFWIGENGLCVPGTSAFAAWLEGIGDHDVTREDRCNVADVVVLKSLYEATGGPGWMASDGWLGDGAVGDWHGVDSDTLGHVTTLDLSNNGLSGRIPASLGGLPRLTRLRINGNNLSGRLPLALTALSLREFNYAETDLCTPANGSFQDWLKSIASHEGTGAECGFAFVSLEVAEAAPLTSIGGTAELSVTGVRDDGTGQPVDNALVEWRSSDPAVATVAGGVVTAVRGGNSTITATYEEHVVDLVVSVWISTMSEVSVRVLYVIPADKEFRDVYSHGVSMGIVDVQGWYRNQLGGRTFDIYSVVPEPCRLPRDEEYYGRGDAWAKVLADVQSCAPVRGDTPQFKWVLYVDVEERCGEPHELGRGGLGLAMMGSGDLEGLANPGPYYYCDKGPYPGTLGRWRGGTAHELAHTFGVPHPPGCDEGLPTCDHSALMHLGYGDYPDTYLREDDKAILRRSPFIKP